MRQFARPAADSGRLARGPRGESECEGSDGVDVEMFILHKRYLYGEESTVKEFRAGLLMERVMTCHILIHLFI